MAWTYTYTYSQVNDYSAKDALASGQAEKIILGSDIDDELSGIQTALNLKLDPGSVASTAEAQAGTDTESFMTPNSVTEWANAGGAGHIGEIWALSDPAADSLLGYDFSAGAGSMVAQITLGTGLALTATTLNWSASGIAGHDSFSDFVADEHVAHSGVTITAGAGLTGGGTIAATRTLDVGAGNGITVNANDVALTDQAATASVPVSLASGVLGFSLSGITEITATGLDQSNDGILINDGGTLKVMPIDQSGMDVVSTAASQNFDFPDCNRINVNTGTGITWTIVNDATTDLEIGCVIFIANEHATADLTIASGTSVKLYSLFNPSGTVNLSDKVPAGGSACLFKVAANTWHLVGNVID